MPTDHTLAIRAALETGGAAAETQLALLATAAGDSQLQLVVEKLTAAEINVLVSDADMSKPSVAHAFITPAQFLEAFDRLGARWSQSEEMRSMADYAEIQSDVEDFLCPMVLATEDPVRAKTMLATLLGHPLGAEAILFTAIGRKDYLEFLLSPGHQAITRGTWQELLQATLEHQPAGYADIGRLAKSIFEEDAAAEEGAPEDGTLAFASGFMHAMHEAARKYHTATEEIEEDFVDI